jgi:hypothetical protein
MSRLGDRSIAPSAVRVAEVSGAGADRAYRLAPPNDTQAIAEVSPRGDIPPQESANFGEKVREALSTYLGKRGDPLDRGLTVRDMVAAGMIKLSDGYRANPASFAPIGGVGSAITEVAGTGGTNTYVVDLTPPPTPTGFAATAAVSSILVTHDAPGYTVGNGHGKTRLYGVSYTSGALPTFAETLLLAEFTGTVYAHPVNPGTTWRLWLKWVTNDGVLSTTPAGGVNGHTATSAYDPATIIKALTGVYGGSQPYYYVSSATTINGVAVPAGTYINDLMVANGTITNAKIANLAVDDAKVSSLSVAKLTAGSLAVGQYIQSTSYVAGSSGWRINANGTAEFMKGSIGGIIIDSTAVRTGQTDYNNGSGFFLGSDGRFSLGNSSGNRMTWDGTNLNIRSSSSGSARLEILNDVIIVYDANNKVRVKIGNLA